jgi:hypothetical protein
MMSALILSPFDLRRIFDFLSRRKGRGKSLIIPQQIPKPVFAEHPTFEVFGQLAGLVGFEILAPLG